MAVAAVGPSGLDGCAATAVSVTEPAGGTVMTDRDLSQVRTLGSHPAVLMMALGNEILPGVVRWHGGFRIEQFLRARRLE